MGTGVRKYPDLIAWQLADAFKREVYRLLEVKQISLRSWKLREQLADVAGRRRWNSNTVRNGKSKGGASSDAKEAAAATTNRSWPATARSSYLPYPPYQPYPAYRS